MAVFYVNVCYQKLGAAIKKSCYPLDIVLFEVYVKIISYSLNWLDWSGCDDRKYIDCGDGTFIKIARKFRQNCLGAYLNKFCVVRKIIQFFLHVIL